MIHLQKFVPLIFYPMAYFPHQTFPFFNHTLYAILIDSISHKEFIVPNITTVPLSYSFYHSLTFQQKDTPWKQDVNWT